MCVGRGREDGAILFLECITEGTPFPFHHEHGETWQWAQRGVDQFLGAVEFVSVDIAYLHMQAQSVFAHQASLCTVQKEVSVFC